MRFSAHHAPEPPRRRFWLRFGLVFFLLAVPVAAFNLAVDPFDFRLMPHLGLIRENITRKNDTMLWAAGELRRIPRAALDEVTLAVVGDSRTDTMCRWPNSPRIFKLGQDRVLNLSVGGASFDESVRLLTAELPRLPGLRAVLFSAPVERVGVPGIDRAANALRLADWPALYALGLGTLASSVDMLSQQSVGKRDRLATAERADIDPARLADPGVAGLDRAVNLARPEESAPLPKAGQASAAMWKATILKIDSARLQKRTREVIAPLVERLRKRGIRIVFFFPPLNPAVSGGIEAKIAALQRSYVAELGRLAPVEDFSLRLPPGIPPVFADTMHLRQDAAHALMAEIYWRHFAARR